MTKVSLVKAVSYEENLLEKITRSIELCDGLTLKNGDTVVIKINVCDFRPPETGAITHPKFLDSMLEYLRKNYTDLKIKVVESDATANYVDMLIKWLGFMPVINKWDAQWVNLGKTPLIKKEINGRHFKTMEISDVFADNPYFITLAKLKTHCDIKLTAALKNQFGCIPVKRKIKFHPYLDDVIVDCNLAMPPNFSITDGIIGLGGVRGPAWGPPINSKVIISGVDPVAVDTVGAKIMGFRPYFVTHIRKAQDSGVGKMNHTIVGESLDEMKTDYCFGTRGHIVFQAAGYLNRRSKKRTGSD